MWGPTAISFAVGRSLSYTDQPHSTGSDVTATYTFDVFCSLDGYGSYGPGGDWGGYWGKQGPELLGHRLASFGHEQRMVGGFRGSLQQCRSMTLSAFTIRVDCWCRDAVRCAGGRPLACPWLPAAQGPQRLRGQGRPQAVAAGDAQQS